MMNLNADNNRCEWVWRHTAYQFDPGEILRRVAPNANKLAFYSIRQFIEFSHNLLLCLNDKNIYGPFVSFLRI